MPSNSITFHQVTPEVLKAWKKELERHDVTVSDSSSGTASGRGVEVRFEYQARKRDLSLHFLKFPDVVTAGYLTGWAHDALVAAGA